MTRILVVEDDAAVRRLMVKALASEGFEVVQAARAAEALAVDGHVDLLVVDVVLPDSRGPEVYAGLAARMPLLRVLYVSGYDASALGIHVLAKPFRLAGLVDAVRTALGGGGSGGACTCAAAA